ncbi:MAG: hypothetical protein JXR64_05660 [Spirochaetales bacterium]|nr:hypothetical protein [Spirochaetales bacterium]
MLEYQIKKLEEKHKQSILKLEPFLLRISGYNPQESRLKVGNYFLHCTPGSFSLKTCNLLLVLGKQEIKYFNQFEDKIVALNLAFDSTYFGRQVSFYLKGKFSKLTNIRDSIYSVNLDLSSISDFYRELFLYLSEVSSIYKKLHSSSKESGYITSEKKIPITFIEISYPNKSILNAAIKGISPGFLEISKGSNNLNLEKDKVYSFKIYYNMQKIKLAGKVEEENDATYIISIDFNMEFIHILSKYMKIAQKQQIDQSEDLEEL